MTNIDLDGVALGEASHVPLWEKAVGEEGQKDKLWKCE